MKSKIINILLAITFVLTLMVPLTGILVHKMASTLFLMLCVIHTIMYRKQLNGRKYAVLIAVFVCFLSGLFGLIYDGIPLILALHKVISIVTVMALTIHIFVYHKRLGRK